MVTVSSLRYSLVADTTRFKAGLDNAQALLAKAERDVNKFGKSGVQNQQKQAQATQQRASAAGMVVASQKAMLATAAKVGGAFALFGELKDSFRLASDLETTTAAFETMTGSAASAQSLISQLRMFDAQTTFGFQDTVQGAKRLMNYGVAANDVVDVLRRLGDISGGSADRLHGLTLAFGQATSLGRLQREEVNQMVERGFNPMVEITKLTGETMEQLSDRMKRGGVSADELRAAIVAATSAGGRFYGLMEKRSQTLTGQIDLLRGQWDMLKTDLATATFPALLTAVKGVNELTTRFGRARQKLADLVMTQSGMAATVGGPNSTMRRRYTQSQTSMLDLFARAGDENARQRTFDAATGVGSSLMGQFRDTASLLAGTARNVAGSAQNALLGNLVGQRETLQRQMEAAANRSTGPTGEQATAAARGSRAEFQARARMAGDKEAAARRERQKQHEESQAKLQQQIDLLSKLIEKVEFPVLVPGI